MLGPCGVASMTSFWDGEVGGTRLCMAGLRARSRGASTTCKKKSQEWELALHLQSFGHLIYGMSLLVGTLDIFLQKLKGVSE